MQNSIAQALQAGLDEGTAQLKKTQLPKAQSPKQRLKDFYNLASGVIDGLDALRDKPGSEFDYSVDNLNVTLNGLFALPIHTNIRYGGGYMSDLHTPDHLVIYVHTSGNMLAFDSYKHSLSSASSKASVEGKEAEPIIKYVAKKAKLAGLVK